MKIVEERLEQVQLDIEDKKWQGLFQLGKSVIT